MQHTSRKQSFRDHHWLTVNDPQRSSGSNKWPSGFPTKSCQSILSNQRALSANLRTFANLSDGMPSFYTSKIVSYSSLWTKGSWTGHSYIKKITKPMMGFKSFHSAKAHGWDRNSLHDLIGATFQKNINTVYDFSRINLFANRCCSMHSDICDTFSKFVLYLQ